MNNVGSSTQAGQKGFTPTHIWKSQHYDWPCALTGKDWHDEATGQDFVEVVTDDGNIRPIPKAQLVPHPGKRAKKAAPRVSLSPAEVERLISWMLTIADETLGNQHEEGDGSFRFGENRALVIHPGGFFHNFAAGRGGTGGVELLAMLHGLSVDAAVGKARDWLCLHEGAGNLKGESEDQEARQASGDAERSAFIHGLWTGTVDIAGTPGWTYLTAARGLNPSDDDLKHLRWLPHARGFGPGAEGAMAIALTNNAGGIEALQLTYVTAAGAKSEVQPHRRTYRGPHDWGGRGLLRFGAAGNTKAFIVEGVEDGLSLRQAGAERVLVLCGLSRLGKVSLPFEIETVTVVRDADEPESNGTVALWRGVVRLACQMHSQIKILVTTRPDAVCPSEPNKKVKDANDLLRHYGIEQVRGLMATAQRIPPFSEFERKAIIEAACEVDNTAYASGRDRIAALLEWRKADLDKARRDRIKELVNADRAKIEERDLPWDDPVPDVAPLLDEIVVELSRYVVASLPMLHSVALWIAFAHLIHRDELHIDISPRLAIQAPDKECGKSVLTEAIACATPRPNIVLVPSASSVFRSIHADRCTLLIDEAIAHLADDRNPELHSLLLGGHRRATAWIPRTERLPDGSFDPVKYNCFTAVVMNGIGVFSDQLQDRSIAIFLQRALAGEVREHLVNAESAALLVIRRKLARWTEDLRELPAVDRPKELANRKGDNWYPLRQVAMLAGGAWPERAWSAATAPLAPIALGSGSALTELLESMWEVFAASGRERMFSSEIVAALLEQDEGKWRQVKKGGRPVDDYYLRVTLKGVILRSKELDKARRWRVGGGGTQWGYTVAHLLDPWLRYLGKASPKEVPAEPEGGGAMAPNTPPRTPAETTPSPETQPQVLPQAAQELLRGAAPRRRAR